MMRQRASRKRSHRWATKYVNSDAGPHTASVVTIAPGRPAMDLGDEGVDAADREQRQHQELARELEQDVDVHERLSSSAASRIDRGTMASSTHTRGSRASAMATNAIAATPICHAEPRKPRPMRKPIAMTRPAAAHATPPN